MKEKKRASKINPIVQILPLLLLPVPVLLMSTQYTSCSKKCTSALNASGNFSLEGKKTMSNPSGRNSENDAIASGNLSKALEKANFTQTCNLLSQFFKEKRSLGNLCLQSTSKIARTAAETREKPKSPVEVTITMKNSAKKEGNLAESSSTQHTLASGPVSQPIDCLPQLMDFDPSRKLTTSTSTTEPKRAQMTIFYGGRVIVFNDLPADKAGEMMSLASKGSSKNTTTTTSFVSPNPSMEKTNSICNTSVAHPSKMVTQPAATASNSTQQPLLNQPTQADASDLPIARRASLYRFFEKRKDRTVMRGPYHMNHGPTSSSNSGRSNSDSELEDHQTLKHNFDLNL